MVGDAATLALVSSEFCISVPALVSHLGCLPSLHADVVEALAQRWFPPGYRLDDTDCELSPLLDPAHLGDARSAMEILAEEGLEPWQRDQVNFVCNARHSTLQYEAVASVLADLDEAGLSRLPRLSGVKWSALVTSIIVKTRMSWERLQNALKECRRVAKRAAVAEYIAMFLYSSLAPHPSCSGAPPPHAATGPKRRCPLGTFTGPSLAGRRRAHLLVCASTASILSILSPCDLACSCDNLRDNAV